MASAAASTATPDAQPEAKAKGAPGEDNELAEMNRTAFVADNAPRFYSSNKVVGS